MPTAPLRICPRCMQQVGRRCTNCNRDTDHTRTNSNSRGYNSHWRRTIRPNYLRQHPLCALCGALAEIPDHHPTTRHDLLQAGDPNPDADHHLRPLCTPCHNQHGPRHRQGSTNP